MSGPLYFGPDRVLPKTSFSVQEVRGMHPIRFTHWFHPSAPVPLREGRQRQRHWRAVKLLHRLVAGSVTVCKIVVLHLILNIRGVPHRISIGRTVEDERDSTVTD
jgi:hypothetical protein